MSCFPEGIETPSLSELCTAPQKSTVRLRYQCELITPMYGGGVEPRKVDEGMPIRAAAIRGQLRFWWRLLFGCPNESHDTLRRERTLWGGLGDTPDEVTSSLVSIRISELDLKPKDFVPVAIKKTSHRNQETTYKTVWADTLNHKTGLQYALFPALGKCDPLSGEYDEEKFLSPGTLLMHCSWGLEIDIDSARAPSDQQNLEAQVKDCVRWWAAFGGVGARTRRGLGAISVRPKESAHPLVVEHSEVVDKKCKVVTLGSPFGMSDSTAQLDRLLNLFREFRQGSTPSDLGYGRKPQSEPATQRPAGRSRWPESDLIRRSTDRWFGKTTPERHFLRNNPVGSPHSHAPNYLGPAVYPRAHFGLPLSVHFADRSDPQEISISPARRDANDKPFERMASPLIMKPVAHQNGSCQMQLLLLPTVNDEVDVRLFDAKAKRELSHQPPAAQSNAVMPAAWTSPIGVFIDFLKDAYPEEQPFGEPAATPPVETPMPDVPSWGALKVDRNRRNGALTVRSSDGTKSASAFGAPAQALFTALPLDIRQKIEKSGSCKLLVTVQNGEIVKLEPAP